MATKAGTLATGDLKCHRCAVCDGYGCLGMLPGFGGVYEGKNFQLNYEAWKKLYGRAAFNGRADEIDAIKISPPMIRCGPVTGAVENIGYDEESDFYFPYLKNAFDSGIGLCVGDGCPDEKLKFGVEALCRIGTKAAFFLKPYPQDKLQQRIEWVKPYAEYIGIDIDSYNIVTMRNLVHLERKTARQLEEFRKFTGVPFVIKGVFTDEDIELIREVKPDVVYVSNHGGRVETRTGSSGDFLAEHSGELKKYCDQIWVDGGIRTRQDIQTAVFYGADKIAVARPLIRATFDGHYPETIRQFF